MRTPKPRARRRRRAASARHRSGGRRRILEIWNKIDRFGPEERENLGNIAARRPPERPCFLVSAETGEGVDALLAAIEERLAATRTTLDLSIDAATAPASPGCIATPSAEQGAARRPFRHDRPVDETKRDIVVNRFDAVLRGM